MTALAVQAATQAFGCVCLLIVIDRYPPEIPGVLLYAPRTFERADYVSTLVGWSPAAAVAAAGPDPITDPVVHPHIPMTTGEFRRIWVDGRTADVRYLDAIEDEFRAGLEWLEATVMMWLGEDVEAERARVWAQETDGHPVLSRMVAA